MKLVGEGADDAGGVFDDTITEMCQELTTSAVPLLLPTPNSVNDTGYNQDRYILNPQLTSPLHLSWFKFLGILFGVAIRTKKPLAIPLASIVWKLLVGDNVSIDDLEEVDALYAQSLRGIRDIHLSGVSEANFSEVRQKKSLFWSWIFNVIFSGYSTGVFRGQQLEREADANCLGWTKHAVDFCQ